MDSRPSWVGDVDAPSVAVLQSNSLSRMARRATQITEEVTKIKQRVDRMIQIFERTPGIHMSTQSPDLEILEDMDELQNMLRDQNQKRKYQQKVSVFIVGYQETCGQRKHLLTQLQEFFSFYSKMSDEQEDAHPEDSYVDLDGVAAQMTGALRSAETAISRLVDIHKEIMDSVGQRLSARADGKRKPADDKIHKRLEKAVNQAKGDIVKLTEQLVQAQEELSLKDQKMKELLKQNETKVLEINYFKGQLEDTKKNLQSLQSETAIQRSLLDAELRKQASRTEELEIQVTERSGLSKDMSTQWEVLNSTIDWDEGDFPEEIKEEKHEPQVTDESPAWSEDRFADKEMQTDIIDEGNVLGTDPGVMDIDRNDVDGASSRNESNPCVEENEESTSNISSAQAEDPFVIVEAGRMAVITLCSLIGNRKSVITSVHASEDSKLLITSQPSSEVNLHPMLSPPTNFYHSSPMTSLPEETPGNFENTEIRLNNTLLALTEMTTRIPAVSEDAFETVAPCPAYEGENDACLLHPETGNLDGAAAMNADERHNDMLLTRFNEKKLIVSHSALVSASLLVPDELSQETLSIPVSHEFILSPTTASASEEHLSLNTAIVTPDKTSSFPPLAENEGTSGLITSLPVLIKNGGRITSLHEIDYLASLSVRDDNTKKLFSDKVPVTTVLSAITHQNKVPDTSLTRLDPCFTPAAGMAMNAGVVSFSDNVKQPTTQCPGTEIDSQSIKQPSVGSVRRPLQSLTSMGVNETPVHSSFDLECHLKGQYIDPAPEEDKGVQTEDFHHIERGDSSGLDYVQSEETHNELHQVSRRLQRFIGEIKSLLMKSGYHSLAADVNVGLQGLNGDAISVNLTHLENIPAVLSRLLQWDGKKKQSTGGFFHYGDNTTDSKALQDRELLVCSETGTQSCRTLSVSSRWPISNESIVSQTMAFPQHDEEHNMRILKRAAQHGRIPLHTYKDACRGMSLYRQLVLDRLQSLVRGYMMYVSWDRAEALFQRQRRHKSHASDTLGKFHKAKQQSMLRWRQQRMQSQDERRDLLASLDQLFHGIQKESGILLIKPVQSWARSATVLETNRHTHFQRRSLQSNWNLSSASTEQPGESLTCCGKARSPAPKVWTFTHTHTEPRPLVITPKLLEMDVHRYLCNECCVMSRIHSTPTCFSLRSSAPLRNIPGLHRIAPFPAL